jgi:hypothetical protein
MVAGSRIFHNLLAVHGDLGRRLDSDAYPATSDFQYLDSNAQTGQDNTL